jgi:hypothetical protein
MLIKKTGKGGQPAGQISKIHKKSKYFSQSSQSKVKNYK